PAWNSFPYNWSSNNIQMLAAAAEEPRQQMAPRPTVHSTGGKVWRSPSNNNMTCKTQPSTPNDACYTPTAATAAAAAAAAVVPYGSADVTPAARPRLLTAETSALVRSSLDEDETCLFLSPGTDLSASMGMRHVASGSALLSYGAAAATCNRSPSVVSATQWRPREPG
ncbi:hypothetical protein Agub_g259, partial [Astrephomene gubernaculifera]